MVIAANSHDAEMIPQPSSAVRKHFSRYELNIQRGRRERVITLADPVGVDRILRHPDCPVAAVAACRHPDL